MEAAGLPRFEMTGEEVIHRGWAITVTLAHFTDPDGVAFDRDVIRHPGAVAVVAITDDDAVVLVQQYRGAVDRWLLELPAGTRDVEGEPAEVTANRELAEEVGYSARRPDPAHQMRHHAGVLRRVRQHLPGHRPDPGPVRPAGDRGGLHAGRRGAPRPVRRHGGRRDHRRRGHHPRRGAGPPAPGCRSRSGEGPGSRERTGHEPTAVHRGRGVPVLAGGGEGAVTEHPGGLPA